MYLLRLLKALSPLSLSLDFKVMELSSMFAQNDLIWLKCYSGHDSVANYLGLHVYVIWVTNINVLIAYNFFVSSIVITLCVFSDILLS